MRDHGDAAVVLVVDLHRSGRGDPTEPDDLVEVGTAETEHFGHLCELLKPAVHRFAAAGQALGTSAR